MEFLFALEKLEESTEYQDWKKENEKVYLVHGFAMVEEGEIPGWQIGYYDSEKDLITPIEVGKEIKIGEAQQAFKKEGTIKELDITKIKTSTVEVLKTNKKELDEKYGKEIPLKTFMVVQNIEEGTVWNITTATQSLNTINIRIDTEKGEVKSIKVQNFMDMQK